MGKRQYKQGLDRKQGMLLPVRVEDYISEGNAVRAVDVYVDSLDLESLGFGNTEGGGSAGQPAYPPGGMLKLYLYGFLQGVRSSRKLARECERNLEVVWLLEGLQPSYKTIADFRKDNRSALKAVNQDFVLLCQELGLYGGELVAVDGSHFRGNVGKKRVYTEKRLKQSLERLEKQIEGYLAELEQSDAAETHPEEETVHLREKLEKLKARQKKNQGRLKKLSTSGEKQLAEVDEDARLLSKNGQIMAGYNVQTVVDEKHKLLVTCAVTQDGNDTQQLAPMAKQAKQVLGVSHLEVVSDAGYNNFDQIKECLDAQITPYVPEPDRNTRFGAQGRFTRDHFTYQADQDCYTCPAGRTLVHEGEMVRHGQVRCCYRSQPAICATCLLKTQCLSTRCRYRSLFRWEHEEIIEAHRHRMAHTGRAKMALRACLSEHPFGTLKRWCGWDHFLLRSLPKVKAEMELWMLGYNFKRVLSILGIAKFMEYCLHRAQTRLYGDGWAIFHRFWFALAPSWVRFQTLFHPQQSSGVY
ncbi:MAG TPA: IS1182 family transposase [Anaerolineales bacterium]